MKSKFTIIVFILFSNCVTYIPKLPFTEEARERNMIAWYYKDYSQSEKRAENISQLGQKYLDFVERKHDDTVSLWIKIQIASLEQMILQNALRRIFYTDKQINQGRFRGGKGAPMFAVTAKSYDELFKIEINKIPHYFILITVFEDSNVYNEIFVLRKEKKYLEIFKAPLLKEIHDDKKIGTYTTKTNFDSSESETKEYVLDSFQTLKKLIENKKIEFEKIDVELTEKGFNFTKFEKDGSISIYEIKLRE